MQRIQSTETLPEATPIPVPQSGVDLQSQRSVEVARQDAVRDPSTQMIKTRAEIAASRDTCDTAQSIPRVTLGGGAPRDTESVEKQVPPVVIARDLASKEFRGSARHTVLWEQLIKGPARVIHCREGNP
jgi:hypothetical protein